MTDVRLSLLAAAIVGVMVASTLAVTGRAEGQPDPTRKVAAAATARTGPARHPDAPVDLPPASWTSVAPTEPAVRYGRVDVVRPSIRIRDLAGEAVERVRRVPDVAATTVVRIGSVRLGDTSTIEVAAVDAVGFRALTPQPTADAIGVWERLDDGEAAFTHAAAGERALELGGYVDLGGPQVQPIRVGALASNGTPPVADAIVNREVGSVLGLDQVAPTVLVGATAGVDVAALADRLREEIGGTVEVVPDPRAAAHVSAEQQRGAATVWDALAMCESSGDWHIDTGNGFYGGLQFLPESWRMVGGTGMPHEASREEQIHRAELLLQIQGWKAWPVCSVRLGLRPPPPDWDGPVG